MLIGYVFILAIAIYYLTIKIDQSWRTEKKGSLGQKATKRKADGPNRSM